MQYMFYIKNLIFHYATVEKFLNSFNHLLLCLNIHRYTKDLFKNEFSIVPFNFHLFVYLQFYLMLNFQKLI